MSKTVNGGFVKLDGEDFYKIENYDHMEDFFMTITSSSDVWNFCWSYGGVTAGRIDREHAIFPYYTADKVSDAKNCTGPYTAIAVKNGDELVVWEPFASLSFTAAQRARAEKGISRNLYKNLNGTKIWFEEINENLNLSFRFGWTSSQAFGLVRKSVIQNLGNRDVQLCILDGAQNIMPASTTSELQNNNSVLLDAYKKTDIDTKYNVALFTLSSVLTDKAEPSEGLYANTCWFSTEEKVIVSNEAPIVFAEDPFSKESKDKLESDTVLKGKRPSCFIWKKLTLTPSQVNSWYQVFDTTLDAKKIVHLEHAVTDRKKAVAALEADVDAGEKMMTDIIAQADGIQDGNAKMTVAHHRANVMFNIMRGGIFADKGCIVPSDFIKFISQRNKSKVQDVKSLLVSMDKDKPCQYTVFKDTIFKSRDRQLQRLFLEYLPITFSRRHGDPSRPWNKFNIKLQDGEGKPILNYEGNWRDIFQNWEALSYSYPEYIQNITAKFLNAMTADGFNPYRITRQGVDWEVPEPDNPWAQFGYWGDHQVIYLQKLLELYSNLNRTELLGELDMALYSSSNIPYRLKSYKDICNDPRNSLVFDQKLSDTLFAKSNAEGSDKKLVQDEDGEVALVSFTAKILQIIIAKAANLVPGGGIWMNTQRPEWNDANNALAGWGLSVVTLCYLRRMLSFLIQLYADAPQNDFTLPHSTAKCLLGLGELYAKNADGKCIHDDEARKKFTDAAGLLFQEQRESLYAQGYVGQSDKIERNALVKILKDIQNIVELSIAENKRDDGLYHTYNTLKIQGDEMKVSRLQEMLEGQVAILSAGLLTPEQVLEVVDALKSSAMYEKRQNSYTLYPNKELPLFMVKNCIPASDCSSLKPLIERSGNSILREDDDGNFHFNPDFTNARVMKEYVESLPQDKKPSAEEVKALEELYEKTFRHQNFTGRSGTFYAYEGLGSIYWHMVSKLLLAVQENAFAALDQGNPCADKLIEAYYDIRSGLSFNKTPEIYGAFPTDPYSHTPLGQGAKQPGMTGQVKEEVLTRWGELGVSIEKGCGKFNPRILKTDEYSSDGKISFTWCGVPVVYHKTSGEASIEVTTENGKEKIEGKILSKELSQSLFCRTGEIKKIDVNVK